MVVKPTNARTTVWLVSVAAITTLIYFQFNLFPQLRVLRDSEINSQDSRNQKWIESAVHSYIDGEYNTTGLRDLCAAKTWQPGLVVSCEKLNGGIGNVRNIALDCLRYTIEAGADLILPRITSRNTYDLSAVNGESTIPFHSFFDHDYFISTMKENCPQMTIHESLDTMWDVPSVAEPLNLKPEGLLEDHRHIVMIAKPQDWRKAFDKWLEGHLTEPKYETINHRLNKHAPIRVNMERSLFTFPVGYDDPVFSQQFGRILRLRADVRRLGAYVLMNLSDRFNLDIDPTKHGITDGKYMGAHLRVEADAVKEGWPSFDLQKDRYIEQAKQADAKVMYVASGDSEATARLKNFAEAKHGISVVTKNELLRGPELAELKALTWDQQGLVDFEVMLKSSVFGGVQESTFAWSLALKRQVVSKLSMGEARAASDPNKPWALVDEYSTIYGPPGAWIWFVDTMWP